MKNSHLIALACAAFVLGMIISYTAHPYGTDWVDIYRPVTLSAWSVEGFCIYGDTGFFNPFYTLFITLPFALLGDIDGRAAWFGFCFMCYVLFVLKARFHPLAGAAFLLNPFVIASLWDGNIDGLVLLGSVVSPAWGIPLLLIKPHMTFVLVVYYAYDAYITGGAQKVINAFMPACVLIAMNIIIHPDWITAIRSVPDVPWNFTLWPSTIMMGIFLTVRAFQKSDKFSALASGVFYSPYSSIQGWSVALPVLRKSPAILPLITAFMWLGLTLLLSS